ncbi:MAG: autotransporter domain-containing protein [Thermoguttaceae bacterium]|nr:autotransporter domain-containing protein [Thermoguttaceae bacterium]
MAKRTNRNHRKNWTRLISGLFVGGVLLFQGTGFITSNLAAAEVKNVNVTEQTEVTGTDYIYGLYGGTIPASGSEVVDLRENLIVDGSATAYLGRLDESASTATLLNGVNLSNFDAGEGTVSSVYVGYGSDGGGTLTINGSGEDSLSSLTIYDGTGRGLFIGTGDSTAAVVVGQHGAISNLGNVTVGSNGTLTLNNTNGSKGFGGTGLLSNAGVITVNNSTEEGNSAFFDNYTDTDDAKLTAAGDIRISREAAGLAINGSVAASNLTLSSNSGGTEENISVTGQLDVSGDLVLDPHVAQSTTKKINLTNTGVIEAGSLDLDSSNKFFDNNGDLELGTLSVNNGGGMSTGSLTVGTIDLGDGGTVTAEGTLSGRDTDGNQVNLQGGQLILSDSLTFKNTTVDFDGTSVSAGDSAPSGTAFVVGQAAEMRVSGTNAQMGTHLSVADGGQFSALEDNTLTLAEDKNLNVNGTVLVDFEVLKDSSDPVFKLQGDGVANFTADSQIKVKDLSEAQSGTYTVTLVKSATASGNSYNSDLVQNSSAFATVTDNRSTATDTYQLFLTLNNFESLGRTVNQKSFGRYVDNFRLSGNESGALKGMLNNIMDLDDPQIVRAVYDSLSAAQKANSMMLAMSDPWQYAFDQMNYGTHRCYTQGSPCSNGICRGQMVYGDQYYADGCYDDGCCGMYSCMAPNSVWASVHHTGFDAQTDNNSDGYYTSRTGISLGFDMINSSDVLAGVTFDYSQPFLRAANHSINMSDFRLGFYGKRRFYTGAELAVYVGGGAQNYTSKRDVDIQSIGLNEFYRSTFNGGTFSAAAQLAHNYNLNCWTVLRPFCQIDTQQVWQGSSAEAISVSTDAAALRYNKASWNRTFARAGVETEVNNRFMRISGRCFYSGQLNESTPEMEAGFVGDYTGSVMTIQGVNLGRSYIDVGAGILGYLDTCYRVALSANYDFAAGDKSKAHTGTVNLSYTF